MSNQLESALVIELTDAIKWKASLAPTATDGSLTTVDLSAPLDITKYARRDRELSHRDVTNATAIVRLALHTDTVWNSHTIRPTLEGVTSGNLPYVPGDTGRVDSTVVHIKNVSLPKDALSTDQDLMGRDQLIYEVLVKACQIFTDPPLTTSGAPITGVTAWSQAEGVDYGVQPSPSLPLNRDTFKNSDVTLAERDNLVAAYAANLCQLFKNPFAYATRLYVRVDGVDARDAEVYTLIRVYYQPGQVYDAGNQVFFKTGWYEALVPTSNAPTTSGWKPIAAPTERIWTAEPALPFRNRIVYDTNAKTLQWFRETAETVQLPQLFALSIPGMFWMQTITTVPQVPERKDAQFWRQKASRISYSGTMATPLVSIPDTTILNSGVVQTDTVGLTAPGVLDIPFNVTLQGGRRYRVSALVKPSQSVEIFGGRNLFGVPGTNQGVDLTGIFQPTSTLPGAPIKYAVVLPPGNWQATIEYTNLSGSTAGFGVRVDVDGVLVRDDTAPFLFQDSQGNALSNGTLLTSDIIPFTATGLAQVLAITWTYGQGALSIHKIRLFSTDNFEGEYYFQTQVFNGSNAAIQKEIATMESTGRKGVYEIVHFDFDALVSASNPHVRLTWLQLPELSIQFRQFSLCELNQTFATPGIEGFEAFKWECLRRAERSVQAAFSEHTRNASNGTVPDFTVDGTLWNNFSSDAWMAFIEANDPRLRQLQNIDAIVSGRQYEVSGSYVVYNGGTFADGSTFFGTTSTSDFTPYHGATVDQLGAFRLSLPVDSGSPALLPLGLTYTSAGTGAIIQENSPIDHVPTLVACQPWMVEAGLYVVDGDFLSPMALSNTNAIQTPQTSQFPPNQPIVQGQLRCPLVTSFPTWSWAGGSCNQILFDSVRRLLYAVDQNPGIDISSSVTNSYISSSSSAGRTFGTFGAEFDPVNDMVVTQSQAFGWSTWNPETQVWLGPQGFAGPNLSNNAGSMRTIAVDTKRGHSLYVGFTNPSSNPGAYEIISVPHATGIIGLVHNAAGLPPLAQGPVYSGAADKFIIFNGTTGSSTWYYLDPVSFVLTPSSITTPIVYGGNGQAIIMGIVDELGIGIAKRSSDSNLMVVDLVHDTVVQSGLGLLGQPMSGCTYNSCTGAIHVTTGQGQEITLTVSNGTYSSSTVNGAPKGDGVFDPFSGLVYHISMGSSQIITD
jgi:hypothetical protein